LRSSQTLQRLIGPNKLFSNFSSRRKEYRPIPSGDLTVVKAHCHFLIIAPAAASTVQSGKTFRHESSNVIM
jgi:hypothetical protein